MKQKLWIIAAMAVLLSFACGAVSAEDVLDAPELANGDWSRTPLSDQYHVAAGSDEQRIYASVTDATAISYCLATLTEPDETISEGSIEGSSGFIYLPSLAAGTYELTVQGVREGYQANSRSLTVYAWALEAPEVTVLSSGTARQSVTLYLMGPDAADEIELYIYHEDVPGTMSIVSSMSVKGNDATVTLPGMYVPEAGSYMIQAKSVKCYSYSQGIISLIDGAISSKFLTLEAPAAETPAVPEPVFSATMVERGENASFSFTVPGADAVAYLMSRWGDSLPSNSNVVEGNTAEVPLHNWWPQNTNVTIWASIDGIWSDASEAYPITIYDPSNPYTVKNGVITGYYADGTVSDLVIPSVINDQTITSIGKNVFQDQKQLISVVFPDTLTTIGEFAFYNCSSLTQITLPEHLVSIDTGAFLACNLTSVNVEQGTETKDWYFYEINADWSEPRVYKVALPVSVTKVDAAFLGNKLPGISFDFVTPESLKTIDAEAFANTSPAFVWLTDGVTSIGSGAFAGCSGLVGVRIPRSCDSIGENAFPAGTILFGEWNSTAEEYATEHGYTYVYYVEGFNG